MHQSVYLYLSKHCSTDTTVIDRLFVSAFVRINRLEIKNNQLLKSYIIHESVEETVLAPFVELLINTNGSFSIEELIELYEFVISPADKVVNGAVYTPSKIREFITNKSIEYFENDIKTVKIADISCGCGGFLFTAALKIKEATQLPYSVIFRNNIFGLDIQKYSVIRTKILLTLLGVINGEDLIEFSFNLYTGDALIFDFKNHIDSFNGFDIIIGNPPYVCSRHLSPETKQLLTKWSVCTSGHPDLYIPFFQIGVENLSTNGTLGYITMNSFFKSLNGRALRDYFQEAALDFKIIDFGSEQIFKSKNTYTCICLIKNTPKIYISFCRINSDQLHLSLSKNTFKINYCDLDSYKGWNLQDNSIITKIESIGTPLGELYKTRHGIATLKNSIYIFKPCREDKQYYYLLSSGTEYPIERNVCRNIVNSNRINANTIIDEIMEKVIFPYTDNETPKSISEDIFIRLYPMAYKYLKKFKHILDARDKGHGKYEKWFCFGRTQSLESMKYKLFFPKIVNKSPLCIIHSDEKTLFYNGQAIIGKTKEELFLIKKIMESRLFWYYIETSSKPYSSNYFSLNGNYIKNFGIYNFSDDDKYFILNETNKEILDLFIERKYGVEL